MATETNEVSPVATMKNATNNNRHCDTSHTPCHDTQHANRLPQEGFILVFVFSTLFLFCFLTKFENKVVV